MEFIVDVQGACNSDFIAKEIALLRRNGGGGLQHFIVKPPFPWRDLDQDRKRQSIWLYHNYHGLAWGDGHIEYKEMERVVRDILNCADKIYVKGDAKKKFFAKHFDGCIEDIEGFPSFNDCWIDKSCLMHSAPDHCSVRNVYMIKHMLDGEEKNHCAEEVMKDVNHAIKEFYGKGSLHNMNVEDIVRLPKEFVLKSSDRDIHHIWYKLPDEWRQDPDFLQCRRCYDHFPTGGRTQIDGPPPMIKNCVTCKSVKK